MYIYIYIHIYMYIYLFIYTYIQTTTNPLQYIYIYLFIYTYIQTTTNPLHTTTQPTRTQPPYPSHAARAPPGTATRNTRRVFKTPWHSHKKHKARLQKKKKPRAWHQLGHSKARVFHFLPHHLKRPAPLG